MTAPAAAPGAPAPSPVPAADPEVITAFLRNLHDEGEVFEVRAPDYSDHPEGRYPSTVSGFFDDPAAAAREVARFAARGRCPAWYVTLNPCKRELLALAANRLRPRAKGTTADGDVKARTNLLVDVDPVRKAGISSTAAELAEAERVAGDVRAFLDARGWPEPIRTMSGNGAGLIYPTHLPADDGGLVGRLLGALASAFDSDAGGDGPRVKVDTAVHNPARVTKLIGTVAAEGDGLPDRPHRVSRLVGVPETPGLVTREMVAAVIADVEAGRTDRAPAPVAETPPAPPPPPPVPRIPDAVTFRQLRADHPALRAAVIEGLLRVGETANVIAASKVGKTWFTYALALCVATGRPLLGRFPCTPSRVLLVDNELHPENIAHRVPRVAEAMGIPSHEYDERLEVLSLRGKLADLLDLRAFLARYPPGYFGLVVIDAWYRALPANTDENANGEVAALYNVLDAVADRMGCAVVCVHHASKGSQSGKAVTDVGSGAGSQSRAVDSHVVIRPHEEDGAFVLDAAVRSWPPIRPLGLRFEWPLWSVDDDLDPSLLKPERPRRPTSKLKEEIERAAKVVWTPALFAERFVTAEPRTAAEVYCDADLAGVSGRQSKQYLEAAVAKRLVHRLDGHKKVPDRYTTRAGPVRRRTPEKARKGRRRGG